MALSLGHLASLYNYDMEEYEKAEQLYLRSIAIGELPGIKPSTSLTAENAYCRNPLYKIVTVLGFHLWPACNNRGRYSQTRQ